jgi:hypothetical protein
VRYLETEINLKKPLTRTEAAYHEAGHATIGRVLTLVCGEASIKRNSKLNRAGYSVCYSPYACAREWSFRGKVRGPKAVWHARIIHCMAGDMAVRELLGDGPLFNDWEEITLMLAHCPKADWEDEDDLDERLRMMTRTLVRRHRARIERVAKALLAKTTLSTEELDKLVGRSVNDIKMNRSRQVLGTEYDELR